MKRSTIIKLFAASVAVVMAGGCATLPTGPSVMVLPPRGKSFAQFRAEDAQCRQWAQVQIGMSPQEAVNQSAASGAAVGTVVGAGIGAMIGAASGHVGEGAAIGAGSGLLLGSASGADQGQVYGWEAQRRYDIAYQQCMYSYGNIIPTTIRTNRVRRVYPPPPPGYYQEPFDDSSAAPAESGSDYAAGSPVYSGPSVSLPPQDFHEMPPDYKEPAGTASAPSSPAP